jgi:hypothetical protein
MPDEKLISSVGFLPTSLMYFCSGEPMHFCSGVDIPGALGRSTLEILVFQAFYQATVRSATRF